MDESGRIDIEIGGLGGALVDAMSSSTTALRDHRSTENQNNTTSSGLLAVDAEKAVDTDDSSLEFEHLHQPMKPVQPGRTRETGKCNLRNSLAWDTTFFTSAGILDPDELSSMIEGVDKSGKHFLPGIEEDIRRSSDTISTLESENLTLESLEADLFEDIRASIQKSCKSSNIAPTIRGATQETETKATCPVKKMDLASKNVMKPKLTTKKQPNAMQGPGKLVKQSSGISQGTQKALKIVGSPKPVLSAPLKRASLGAHQVKMEKDQAKNTSAVTGKVVPARKTLGLGGPIRTLPKPAPSSKSASVSSSTATKKVPPKASSSDSSGSGVSANVSISPVKSTRRKMDSRTGNPAASSSILKVPSKLVLKKKGQSNLSPNLKSSNLSASSSPTSSISEWSTESCSSTSTFNQMSNTTRASIESRSSCVTLDNYTSPAVVCNLTAEQNADRHPNKVTQLPGDKVNTSSTRVGAPSQPAMAKPSGLRMPSPKLGFFEGVKPAVRTPTRNIQSYSGKPAGAKIGPGISTPSGGSNKANSVKLQPARGVMGSGKMKLEAQKPSSPMPSQKPSNGTTEGSNCPGDINNCLSIPAEEVQNEEGRESCMKAKEVELGGPDKADNVPDSGAFTHI